MQLGRESCIPGNSYLLLCRDSTLINLIKCGSLGEIGLVVDP